MDFVIASFLVAGSFLVRIVGNLLASELYDCAPSLAHWLIDRAVNSLAEQKRARYREEWYAHLDECPG